VPSSYASCPFFFPSSYPSAKVPTIELASAFVKTRGRETTSKILVAETALLVEIADDLSYWSVEIPGKVLAKAEALTGPTTPPGKRVQTINPPGSEVGPGTSGAVATWGKAVVDKVDTVEFKWERKGRSSKHIPFEWSGP
jgi:hypothetical protein